MKTLRAAFSFAFAALTLPAISAEDLLDQVGEALTFSAFNDNVRARLSGTLDLEIYSFEQPPPGVIFAEGESLFNPRLTLFFDAQVGSDIYFFVQSRVDRGFDPTDEEGAEVRLDEYALRYTPWKDGRFNLQIGKFPTVAGNWIARHLSWENPFINAPLPYENITAIEDTEVPASGSDFNPPSPEERYEYNPLIWGPSYASGVSVAGRFGQFEYAGEIKNSSLSSRPESWDANRIGFEHPTVTGRLGFRPNQMWNFGVSASDGAYFRPEVDDSLPRGRGIGDYHQQVLGQDISFAWRHLQLWAEFYEARFEVPNVGDADTFIYYLEAKYKFTPQLFGAARWNQQFFANVPDGFGGTRPWGYDLWRIDLSTGYRFTAHTQLKIQYSLDDEKNGPRDLGHTWSAQFTLRF
jgi:hypothetical protein